MGDSSVTYETEYGKIKEMSSEDLDEACAKEVMSKLYEFESYGNQTVLNHKEIVGLAIHNFNPTLKLEDCLCMMDLFTEEEGYFGYSMSNYCSCICEVLGMSQKVEKGNYGYYTTRDVDLPTVLRIPNRKRAEAALLCVRMDRAMRR